MLIVVLFTLTLLAMFLGAALKLLPMELGEAGHSARREAALQAARSGVQYAWSRLQENVAWRGDGNGLIVDTPGLRVEEDHGNVVGTITSSDGTESRFQIRFNPQNGTNPTGLTIDTPYLSLNNLQAAAISPVARPLVGTGHYPVASDSPTVDVPRYVCDLHAVGVCGNQKLVVDSVICRKEMVLFDSAFYSAAGVNATLYGDDAGPNSAHQGKFILTSSDSRIPGMRGIKNDFNIDGVFKATGGSSVTLGPGHNFVGGSGSDPVTPAHQNDRQQDQAWPQLKFDQLVAVQSGETSMPGGTYVWRTSASGYQLDYYDQAFDGTLPSGAPVKTIATANDLSGVPGFSGSGLTVDPATLTTRIDGRVRIQPSQGGNIPSLSIVADNDVLVSGRRPLQYFNSASGDNPALVTDSGSSAHIVLTGSSKGTGSIVTSGQLSLQASSVFEADPSNNIAVYAKGDVNLLTPPAPQTNLLNTFLLNNNFTLSSSLTATAPATTYSELAMTSSISSVATLDFPLEAQSISLSSAKASYDPAFAAAPLSVANTFSSSVTTEAVAYNSAGSPTTVTVSSPLFLQYLDLQPTFPLTPGDVAFSGVVYTESSIHADLGTNNLFVNGVMAAYGGNPQTQFPGGAHRPSISPTTSSIGPSSLLPTLLFSPSTSLFLTPPSPSAPKGLVDLKVGNVQFMYDPGTLVNQAQGVSSSDLELVFLAAH